VGVTLFHGSATVAVLESRDRDGRFSGMTLIDARPHTTARSTATTYGARRIAFATTSMYLHADNARCAKQTTGALGARRS